MSILITGGSGRLGKALKKEVFVKAIVCRSTDLVDIEKSAQIIANIRSNIPFILQPNSFEADELLMKKVRQFQTFALEFLSDVRIVPQVHKLVGVK